MGTIASTLVDAIDIPVLDVDEDRTSESIRDLIVTLRRSISIFSSVNNDDDENNDGNCISYMDHRELTLSGSENYLQQRIPQYSSSSFIFATLSPRNFLFGKEMTEIFSRFVNG